MDLGIIYADHVNHQCVDDEDDHRILVTKCGLRVGYVHPKNRQESPFGNEVITCLECLTLDENIDPRQRYSLKAVAAKVLGPAHAAGKGMFYDYASSEPYQCSVPMCGESGVCEECRKRGAR
jgi:hypothetical protein